MRVAAKGAKAQGCGPIHVGCAGWSIPRPYAEQFGGEGTHLERYGRVLRCAEINSSFYRSHRASTWERWAASVPEDFRFSVKASKAITHEAKLVCSREQLAAFVLEAAALGSKAGPILFQLPPRLNFDAEVAKAFFGRLREIYAGQVVVEPRHSSWFTPEVAGLLADWKVARAAADPAVCAEAAVPGGWNGLVYYRLHGSPRKYYSAYGSEFIGSLAAMLALQSGASELWCIFDNTASGAAAGDALALEREVRRDGVLRADF